MDEATAVGQDFNSVVQLGPQLQSASGAVNGNSASFYLSVPDLNVQVFAAYSTDAGGSWIGIDPNSLTPVSGSNSVQWRIEARQDNACKFVIGDVA